MPVELVRSPSLADAPYAYAAIAPAGARIVGLAGACPLDAEGNTVEGSFEEQTRAAFDNLVAALDAAGATVADILATRLLVSTTRREDLLSAWNVFRAAMGDHDAPSTLVGVTVLGYPGQLVEIEATAAVASSS